MYVLVRELILLAQKTSQNNMASDVPEQASIQPQKPQNFYLIYCSAPVILYLIKEEISS